jgi:hypothetical protein
MIEITADVAAKLAELEEGTCVTAGTLRPETFARQVADATMRSGSQENYLPVFSRLISMKRREEELTIEQLSERADVDAVELFAIEENLTRAPEPRVVSKLARALQLPSGKLMQLAGHLHVQDAKLPGAALRFAAQSGSLEKLSSREKTLLHEFVNAMSED